jgi:acetyl esterase
MTTLSKTVAVPAPTRASYAFAPAAPKPPSAPRLRPAAPRKLADRAPAAVPGQLPRVQNIVVPGGPAGETRIRLFRPAGVSGPLPVVIYVHSGDAPFSDLDTHLQARRLATEARAAVVVVDYTLVPSARIIVAIEENYVAAAWAAEHGNQHDLDGTRIALGSDPSGADMGDELMLMADARGGPRLAAHVLWSSRTTAVLRAALAA